jgi:hypothetical protein
MTTFINQLNKRTTTNDNGTQPIRGTWGASILGPRNVAVERENPDLLASPETTKRRAQETVRFSEMSVFEGLRK